MKPNKMIIMRLPDNDKLQTLGNGFIEGHDFKFKTVELEYNDNKKRISCIPKGTYIVVKRYSPKYGNHFHISNVPNRDYILMHQANFSRQLLGCVAVGDSHIDIDKDGLKDVTNSVNTMKKLNEIMPDEFTLIIE